MVDCPLEQGGLAEARCASDHERTASTPAYFLEDVLDALLLRASRDQRLRGRFNRRARSCRRCAADGAAQFEPASKNLPGRLLQRRNERRVDLQEPLNGSLSVALLQVT